MKCSKAAGLLSDYVDGLVPIPVRRELEAHLAQCERCSRELRRLNVLLSDLRLLAHTTLGVDCWPGIRARIQAREKLAEGFNWRWILRPVALGPAVAAVALAAGLILGPARPPRDSRPQATAATEYRSYFTAHARAEREQPLNDPDVAFVTAQLESSRFASDNGYR